MPLTFYRELADICSNEANEFVHCQNLRMLYGTGGRTRTLIDAVLETAAKPLSYTDIGTEGTN